MNRVVALAVAALAACGPGARAPRAIENRPLTSSADVPEAGPLTPSSIETFLRRRFARQLAAGTFVLDWNDTTDEMMAEASAAMDWRDLAQLAAAVPDDFDARAAPKFTTADPANIPSTLRVVMIVHDARRYIERAWQHHWTGLAPGDRAVYDAYHLDLGVLRAAGITFGDDGT